MCSDTPTFVQDGTNFTHSNVKILNQHIDDEDGIYRVKFGQRVGYLTITADVFDEDTMCRPYLLIPALPEPPAGEWTRMHITRSPSGPLQVAASNDPLPEIEYTWHEERIDVHSLEPVDSLRSGVQEVIYKGVPAIAKIATFEWEIPRREQETWAYSILDQHHRQNPHEPPISPRMLGHLTEGGRVIGLLLEKLYGSSASPEDFAACRDVLQKLHDTELTHGDINRYNFIIDQVSGQAILIDFEHTRVLDPGEARKEMDSLYAELSEDTGRGGPGRVTSAR